MSSTMRNIVGEPGIVSVLTSYSTRDIERSVFYGSEREVDRSDIPSGPSMLLVVNGDYFELNEDTAPIPGVSLTPDSGLIRLSQPEGS